MATRKLTKDLIRGLKPATASFIIWDTEIPGFGLRVQPSGVRTYLLKYRVGRGRQAPIRKPRISSADSLTLDQAREIARKWIALAAAGGDPYGELQAQKGEPTVTELARDYLERHAVKKRTGNEDRRRIDRHVLPRLGRLKVVEVTHRQIEDLHRALAATPYEANRTAALLSKMLTLAIRWGWRSDNPVTGIERYHEDRRERFLSPAELIRLGAALVDHPDKIGAAAIRFLLLTGARRGEALAATWDEFDLDRGSWTKPSSHTKQKKEHRVPLSPPVRQLLQELPRAGQFVFPGRYPGQPRTEVRRVWAEVCKAAGIEGVRVHDLRHTFASVLASSGLSLPVIGALLGHAQAATTQRYAHLMDDPLREATERAARQIEGRSDQGEVVPLAGRS
jgi:integrase